MWLSAAHIEQQSWHSSSQPLCRSLGAWRHLNFACIARRNNPRLSFTLVTPYSATGSLSCDGASTGFILGRLPSSLCLPTDFISLCDISLPMSLFLQLAPARSSFCLLLHWHRRRKAFPGLRAVLCSLSHFPYGKPTRHGFSPRPCALPTPPNVRIWDIWGVMGPLLFSVGLPPVSSEDTTKRPWVLPHSSSEQQRNVEKIPLRPLFLISVGVCRNL